MWLQVQLPGKVEDIFTSAMKIKVGAGKWTHFVQQRLGFRIAGRPKKHRLAANQNIGIAAFIRDTQDSAKLFKGKAHGWNQAQRAITRMTLERLVRRPLDPSARPAWPCTAFALPFRRTWRGEAMRACASARLMAAKVFVLTNKS